MTTNKPEVVYATNLYSSAPVACLMRRTGEKAEPVIRLRDYEALQSECEKLRKDAERFRWLIERGDDFQWENIIRLDIEDFPSRCAAIDTAMQETTQ